MIDEDLQRRFLISDRHLSWTDLERARQLREAISLKYVLLAQLARDPKANAARIREEESQLAADEEELKGLTDSLFLL